jgi:hypothetical protein
LQITTARRWGERGPVGTLERASRAAERLEHSTNPCRIQTVPYDTHARAALQGASRIDKRDRQDSRPFERAVGHEIRIAAHDPAVSREQTQDRQTRVTTAAPVKVSERNAWLCVPTIEVEEPHEYEEPKQRELDHVDPHDV